MNSRSTYLRKIIGIFLVALLLLAIALLSSTTVAAQGRPTLYGPPIHPRPVRRIRPFYDPFRRNRYDYYYSQYVFSSTEAAEQQGYHDGLKTGLGDAKNRRSYDPERSHYFHDAGFGNFAEAYRSGFARGYQAGYRS